MAPNADEAGPRRRRLRAAVAVALVLGAAGLLTYGAAVHERPVQMDQKVALPAPPGIGPAPDFGPLYETITFIETEPELVREVTYGGVMRLPTGQIKRTYTGRPPTLCPT